MNTHVLFVLAEARIGVSSVSAGTYSITEVNVVSASIFKTLHCFICAFVFLQDPFFIFQNVYFYTNIRS